MDSRLIMAKDKKFTPSGQAGLIRYFDEEKEGLQLKPIHVIATGIIFVLIVKVLPIII